MSLLDYLNKEAQFVEANERNIAKRLASIPTSRAEAFGNIGDDLTIGIALSLHDDAELGRIVRELFWEEIRKMARAEAEYRFVSQETGD